MWIFRNRTIDLSGYAVPYTKRLQYRYLPPYSLNCNITVILTVYAAEPVQFQPPNIDLPTRNKIVFD